MSTAAWLRLFDTFERTQHSKGVDHVHDEIVALDLVQPSCLHEEIRDAGLSE